MGEAVKPLAGPRSLPRALQDRRQGCSRCPGKYRARAVRIGERRMKREAPPDSLEGAEMYASRDRTRPAARLAAAVCLVVVNGVRPLLLHAKSSLCHCTVDHVREGEGSDLHPR